MYVLLWVWLAYYVDVSTSLTSSLTADVLQKLLSFCSCVSMLFLSVIYPPNLSYYKQSSVESMSWFMPSESCLVLLWLKLLCALQLVMFKNLFLCCFFVVLKHFFVFTRTMLNLWSWNVSSLCKPNRTRSSYRYYDTGYRQICRYRTTLHLLHTLFSEV